MNSLLGLSSKQGITVFFLWYRFITLGYVAILALTSLKIVSGWLLAATILYSVLLYIFRSAILNKLQVHPYLLLIDVFIVHVFRVASGAYESPYLLYTFSPLFLAAFLLGYRGAILFAGVESVFLVSGTYWSGHWISYLAESGEHISTYFLFYFLIAISMAYLADLLDKLEATNKKKTSISNDLAKGRKCLEISLAFNRLSDRETQVLMLSSEGRTISQVASALGVSENTIKTYLKRINEKLGVSSKKEAISKVAGQEDEHA